MNVTVTPLAAVPLDVTVATSMLVKASPTFAFCPDPLVAVIAMVGGGGGVLELLLRTRQEPESQANQNQRENAGEVAVHSVTPFSAARSRACGDTSIPCSLRMV